MKQSRAKSKYIIFTHILYGMLIGFLYFQNIFSQTTIKNSAELISLGNKISYFEDEHSNLSIQDLLKAENQKKFKKNDKDIFAHIPTKSSFWFKIEIKNESLEDLWLEIGTINAWYIDLYIPDSTGNYGKAILSGSLRKSNDQFLKLTRGFWFKIIDRNDQQSKTIYFKISEETPFDTPIHVGSLQALSKNNTFSCKTLPILRIFNYLFCHFLSVVLVLLIIWLGKEIKMLEFMQ